MKENKLTKLPDEIDSLPSLEYLDLSGNNLKKVPLTAQSKVKELYLDHNELYELDSVAQMKQLQRLDVSYNSLSLLPENIFGIESLELLYAEHNGMLRTYRGNDDSGAQKEEGTLKLRKVALSNNRLVSIPAALSNASMPQLEEVEMSNNWLEDIKKDIERLGEEVLTYDNNYIDCDNNAYLNCCANTTQKTDQQYTVSLTLAIIALVIVTWGVVLFAVVMYLRAKHANNMQLYNMVEMDSDSTGLRVTPSVLTFGSNSAQLPVYRECKDVLFIEGTRSARTAFRLVLPTVPSYKCILDAAMTQGEVAKGEEIGIELAITMMCTTSVQIPLLVVTENGYATVRIEVESQLSTRLDADEIELGPVLGVGGYGTVFRGSWRGVDVAVKAYNQTVLADFATRSDFEREVEMCFKLRMPYIVTFYGKTVTPDKTYIVMEYMPYGSLAALMTKRRLSLRYKTRMALDIARGMNYLHKNRIIHRDLKPDNVLVASVDADSCVCGKLSDFNTSRFMGNEALLAKTRGVGTPIYMAPEIHDGKRYSSAADVYSFALTMWSIWAQKEPYSELTSSLQLYQLIINGERLPVPAGIPEPLARLTRECWAQDPDERPSFATIVSVLEPIFRDMSPDSDNPDLQPLVSSSSPPAAAAAEPAATPAGAPTEAATGTLVDVGVGGAATATATVEPAPAAAAAAAAAKVV